MIALTITHTEHEIIGDTCKAPAQILKLIITVLGLNTHHSLLLNNPSLHHPPVLNFRLLTRKLNIINRV